MALRGKDFGQERPPLSVTIRDILREYPSGQIFKVSWICSYSLVHVCCSGHAKILNIHSCAKSLQEIIQNADDARATEVKFFLDCRNIQTLHPSLINQELHLHHLPRFRGPALLAYNNAPFTDDDWKGIRKLQQSGKAENPFKVGRFGIGFNSVYHITGT